MNAKSEWWKAPDEEEYHTPRVWEAIAKAAEAAGDHRRAEYARAAGEAEERNMGAA